MKKQVIIAEKPSVAREIAKIVGATEQHEGYLSKNNEIFVTWAFGHLVQLSMPEDLGYERFKKENLPIIPDNFQLIRRLVKTKEGYRPDEKAIQQLEIIQRLFNQSDEIIVATDAGREGELIFRYIYQYLHCHTPFVRLWTSSLTDKAIREGLDNVKSGTEYDNLFSAAKARSEADWLIGINATQALTIAAGKGIFSLGRVQTPTLAMICQRFLENKNFTPIPYWQIAVSTEKYGVEFIAVSDKKYETKDSVLEDSEKIKAVGQITVKKVEKKEVEENPPLLFDLTALQKEANIKFDFSADKTLSIAQRLYEKKLISYPRTGSRYLTEDVFEEIPNLMNNLEQYPVFSEYVLSLKGKKLNRKCVDSTKVTDHHALITTETHIPPIMEEDETRIFNLVAGRMLETISGSCIKESTCIYLESAGISFQIRGNVIKEKGWRAVFNSAPEKSEDENIILPVMEEDENFPLKNLKIQDKQTKTKPLYTEATLLGSMENCGKELTDEDERKAMKNSGLGTPATRAAIIENLVFRDYVRREKKTLIPTDKGLATYKIVQNKKIADIQLTGEWENFLSKIEAGTANAEDFHKNIVEFTCQITNELLNSKIVIEDNSPKCICPKCRKSNLLFFNKVVKCSDPDCKFVLFRNKGQKTLTDKNVLDLIEHGKTKLIKGFKNKDGKVFDASLVFGEDFQTKYEFPPKK